MAYDIVLLLRSMNKWIHLFVFCGILAILSDGCQPLDPCLKEDTFNVKVGDTVFIKSCDKNAEIFSWEIDKERVNTFLNPPQPFYSHFADSGGGPCDPFVYLIFHDTGLFKVRCHVGKISNGSCADDLTPKDTEFSTAKVTVRDTARNRN
jgi:hypothetical protein